MTSSSVTPSPALSTCPRCGAALHPLADLANLALQLRQTAAAARRDLDRMRLAFPSTVGAALAEIRLDAPILARRIACHAGACSALAASSAPSTSEPDQLAAPLATPAAAAAGKANSP